MAFQEARAGLWLNMTYALEAGKSHFWTYTRAGACAKEKVGMGLWNLSAPGVSMHTRITLVMPR